MTIPTIVMTAPNGQRSVVRTDRLELIIARREAAILIAGAQRHVVTDLGGTLLPRLWQDLLLGAR